MSRRFTLDGRARILLDFISLAGISACLVALAIAVVAWAASWSGVLVVVAAGVGVLVAAATAARVGARWRVNRAAREQGTFHW